LRKKLKTKSKLGNKRQRNACSNYAPLDRTGAPDSERERKKRWQTPHFRTYSHLRSSPNFARW